MAASRTQSTTGAPSILHHQNVLPTRLPVQSPASMTVSLPSFKHFAEVADQSQIRYMRAPSVGYEYIPVPLIGAQSTLVSPPESVASPTPTPSRSVSPVMAKTALPIRRAKRQSPTYRVEKTTKSGGKHKNYSATAKAQEIENNIRIDTIQQPYKAGRVPGSGHTTGQVSGHHSFPRFDFMHVQSEAKRAKSVTGSSDPNTRHNMAQTHLRAEKGGSRMTLQRLLVSGIGWKGRKLQTVVNARSSGMLYEEKDTLEGTINFNVVAIILLQELFDEDGMRELGTMLELFEPEYVGPAEVARDARDDDKTHELKCQGARIKVIEEAHLPLGLKHIRSRDELLEIIQQKLMPIASDFGKAALQDMFFRKPREARALL
jgi:hypothetical protein